ncbi:acyltransferase family protein [Streptomyces leeuwenhoekii]|uniref:acyltransferase family protein n=1 Tax=Streptomyces leeuwenhoekii TaxID=1437453 RepID=UPI00099D7754|nr:acyltransferase family protein [Streptomyces leeuwenhoekii]
MTDSLRPYGNRRTPLPPAQSSVPGVPSPRPTPQNQHDNRAAPSPAAGARPTGSGRQRDAFFDNAKYLAIVLVGVGHAWGQILDGNRTVETLYRVVYTFHMPAFIIISGYFSRGFDMSPRRVKRLVTGVAVPYVVFEIAYSLHKRVVDHDPQHDISLLDPTYLLWFLCALFVWRLTTPLWKTVRRPLPIALAIALLASMTPSIGNDLNMQRVLQFLPCFVLGLMMRPEHFQLVRRRSVRIWSVPVAAAAVAVAWWSVPRMDTAWFYRNTTAQSIGAPWWTGPVVTLALFGCSLVLTACFFAWVPGRRMWFTALGAGTIYGYLLHGFLVKTGNYEGWFGLPALSGPAGEIGLTVLAAVVITLLCTAPVRRVLRCVVEPGMEWAFRRDAAELAREREKRDGTGQRVEREQREKVSA